MSVRKSLTVALLGGIGAAVLTYFVLRNEYGVGVEVCLAASSLAAFGIAAYGLVQTVLAIVDSAGERRRQERTVTERRTGDRARPPRT
jgi:hypothetical protein